MLEPIMRIESISPAEYEGTIIGDISSRRGEIVDRSLDGATLTIVALAPLANLFGYINNLRSGTQGHGTCSMRFSHFAEVPSPPDKPDGWFPPALGMRLRA